MFQGFPKEVIDFMWGIRFNNERSWFEAHKAEYQANLYLPMKALADEVSARFEDKHPDLALNHRVSRIYRDARRLHGRGPYKDHLWWTMERPAEHWSGQPVFWFELTPENWSYGMGFWMAPAVTMAKFRARIDRDPKPMEKLARTLERQEEFRLEGECYKRPKGACGPLLAPWYNRKGFSLSHTAGHEGLLWSHDLADRLMEGYEFLLPYYRYFVDLEGDPDPRSSV